MTWDGAWALGAVDTPVEVGRLIAYCATNGRSGVVGSTDCQVRELAVPGTSIRVMSGAVIAKSDYPSAGQQSYAARNPDEDVVPVTATGSAAGRSDLVVARILDAQYAGASDSKPETWIVPGVTANTKTVADATAQGKTGLQAAVALARLDIPASTATITQNMIKDLRQMVAPRTSHFQWIYSWGDDTITNALAPAPGVYERWPQFATVDIDIPPWAVRATVQATITCGVQRPSDNSVVTAYGHLRTVLANVVGDDVYYNVTVTGNVETATYIMGQDSYLPAAVRGTTQKLMTQGTWGSGTGSSWLLASWGTTVAYWVTFYESPDATA